jgi:hypothetical protein
MNHHEGDWEMTAVYLKNEEPHAMLMSQHGAGNIEWWDDVIKALDMEGNPLHILLFMLRLVRTPITASRK